MPMQAMLFRHLHQHLSIGIHLKVDWHPPCAHAEPVHAGAILHAWHTDTHLPQHSLLPPEPQHPRLRLHHTHVSAAASPTRARHPDEGPEAVGWHQPFVNLTNPEAGREWWVGSCVGAITQQPNGSAIDGVSADGAGGFGGAHAGPGARAECAPERQPAARGLLAPPAPALPRLVGRECLDHAPALRVVGGGSAQGRRTLRMPAFRHSSNGRNAGILGPPCRTLGMPAGTPVAP